MNKNTMLFNFDSIFTRKRGERLISSHQIEGDIRYISSTKNNNGISGYIAPPDFMSRHKNKLTISNSGSVGYCFFHDYEFVASDHVTVIGVKDEKIKVTKNIAIFLKPIFESIRYKYSFGREISDSRLSNEKILLPITNKNCPDWLYMENYINSIVSNVLFNKPHTTISQHKAPVSSPVSVIKKNVVTWADIKIKQVFDVFTGRDLIISSLNAGEFNVVSHSKENNGVCCTTQEVHERQLFRCIETISLADRGNFYATVQLSDFYIATRVKALKAKFSNSNKYKLIFLATIINNQEFRFSYGRNCCDDLENLIIKLPVYSDKNGNAIVDLEGMPSPDYDYMEKYILNLPYGDRI